MSWVRVPGVTWSSSQSSSQVAKGFCTILISRHLLIPGNAEKLLSRLQEVLWDVEVSAWIQYYPSVTLLGGLSSRLLGFLEQLLCITEKG